MGFVARRDDRRGRGRFSRSGHTPHQPQWQPGPPADDATDRYDPNLDPTVDRRYDGPYWDGPPGRRDRSEAWTDRLPAGPDTEADTVADTEAETVAGDPDREPAPHHYGSPTYHRGAPATAPLRAAEQPTTAMPGTTTRRSPTRLGRATVSATHRAARGVTNRVISASKSDGAAESGLTALIWNQVLSYGTDAMVTVALAGTVFFGASPHAQRGNVLLYLLITMAPFALVAPVIGPALDRLQHGRRWAMAGTAAGRAVLALIMAAHSTELLVLYPCALGSLVLSKAYGVIRAAAAPRLVPPGMTLTEANGRLTIFGLASTLVLGGFVGAVIKVTGNSYTTGLVVTAFGFAACAYFAFRLPKQVDSAAAAPRHPQEPLRPRRQLRVPTMGRIVAWARKGFEPHLVVALQGESVLRLLSGMLTIYLAFYVESTSHGLGGVVQLGAVIGAAGFGNFTGTAIGTRLKQTRPELTILASTVAAALVCLLCATMFSVLIAVIAMYVAAVGNALSKIALDSLIQHDVVETLRSSAFARSETFLQLAWVVGAAIGVVLPSSNTGDGAIAFVVATVITAIVAVVTLLRHRATSRLAARRHRPAGLPMEPGG